MEKSSSSQNVSSGIFGRPLSSFVDSTDYKQKSVELQNAIKESENKISAMAKKISDLEVIISERDNTIRNLETTAVVFDEDDLSLMSPMDSSETDMVRHKSETQKIFNSNQKPFIYRTLKR